MDPDWQRLKEAVADALELPADRRAAFLDAACADASLRRRALAMVEAATRACDFLEEPALVTLVPESVQHLPAGSRIGTYLVEELIGEGGFSEVYRAVQLEPIRRVVAIKLLKPGMDSRAVLLRFANERQTLARMSHRNIAQVLDAGATDGGRPFVVMELVAGAPLQRQVDRGALELPARLALFLEVCDAVAHAHRRGVIHRDLKPSNVLVEMSDEGPRVKVIDFGIAKLLDDTSELTRGGPLIGTPAYASPEQLDRECGDVDTRADVYALGVMLYELLTGRRPTDGGEGRPLALVEILNRVREGDFVPPSQRAARALPRELDWIAAKALARDRNVRYATVDALANDVRRFLRDEALSVGPPTLRYHFAKFARRHRALLVAASLVTFAILAGGTAAAIGFVQARRARDEARGALREAEATADYLARMLQAAQPDAVGRDVKVVDMLAASDRILAESAEFPDVAARLRGVVGRTYHALGEYALAEQHLRQAAAILEDHRGPDAWPRIELLYDLASALAASGRWHDAEPIVTEIDTRARALRGPEHPYSRGILDLRAKAAFDAGHAEVAADALRRLLALDERDGRYLAVIQTLGNLSQVLLATGKLEEAEQLARRGYDMSVARLGPDHTVSFRAGRKLLGLYARTDQDERLAATAEPLLARARTKLGADHPDTMGIETYLANALTRLARYDVAEPIYRRLVAHQERRLGRLHAQAIIALTGFASLLEAKGELAEAELRLGDALARLREQRGTDDLDARRAQLALARVIAKQGRHREVAGEYAEVVAALRATAGDADATVAAGRTAWAHHLLGLAQQQHADGEDPAAMKTLETAFAVFDEMHEDVGRRSAAEALVNACIAAGDATGAARWRDELR
ncbi:MAG: protein kinase [Planctomycetota bacterium]